MLLDVRRRRNFYMGTGRPVCKPIGESSHINSSSWYQPDFPHTCTEDSNTGVYCSEDGGQSLDKGGGRNRREFNGPIQEQMEAACQYVLEKINRGMKIDGIYRQDVYELPIDSIRELIANAVAHRSYLDPGNIQVALYDNRLEITSPGMLMNGVTIEKMKEGYSKIRNRAIANAFSYMKIIEKWGSGIPRIIRECQEYGIPEPELIDFDGDFRINMYRQPLLIQAGTIGTNSGTIGTNFDTIGTINGIKVTSPEERVLTIMKQNARVTQKELQKELGVSLRTIKRMIAELQDKGYIVRRGNNRSGEWIVKG